MSTPISGPFQSPGGSFFNLFLIWRKRFGGFIMWPHLATRNEASECAKVETRPCIWERDKALYRPLFLNSCNRRVPYTRMTKYSWQPIYLLHYRGGLVHTTAIVTWGWAWGRWQGKPTKKIKNKTPTKYRESHTRGPLITIHPWEL